MDHANDRELHFRKMAYITDVVVNGVAALQIVLALILVQYDKYKKKREEIFVGVIQYPLLSNWFKYLEHSLLMIMSLVPTIFLLKWE